MNAVLESILNRRSTRAYRTEQIKEEELETIVKAGIYAPSAMNGQPWHFTVIQDKAIIDKLHLQTKELVIKKLGKEDESRAARFKDPNWHVFHNAPTIIIVSGEKSKNWAPTDCAAASENMLIAAEALGIGSCWIGFVRELFGSELGTETLQTLGINEEYCPYYALAFGYKQNNDAMPPERRENTVNYIR